MMNRVLLLSIYLYICLSIINKSSVESFASVAFSLLLASLYLDLSLLFCILQLDVNVCVARLKQQFIPSARLAKVGQNN